MTDPIDETQPHATRPSSPGTDEPERPAPIDPPTTAPPPAASNLRVDPGGPMDTGWREPAWFPPRDTDRGPSLASLAAGLALVIIGLYFFLDRTLGLAMPRIHWSTIWPVILIAIGAIVLVRSVRRRS